MEKRQTKMLKENNKIIELKFFKIEPSNKALIQNKLYNIIHSFLFLKTKTKNFEKNNKNNNNNNKKIQSSKQKFEPM